MPNKQEPVSMERILEVEKKLGIIIPKVYKEFLKTSNGAEFNEGVLYDIDTLEEAYQVLEFAKYAPEYISIGNDNGDYELVMEAKENSQKFGFLEQGSIGSLEPELWKDFNCWISQGCSPFRFEGEEDIGEGAKFQGSWAQQVDVVLVRTPVEKAKGLMKIRKALLLETPISELLAMSEHMPYILTERFSYAQAKMIIDKEKIGDWVEIKLKK